MRMGARRPGAPTTPRSVTGVPFLTSWYKGFREQNVLKRLYNSVMARGDRVVAVSDQIAELISERYRHALGPDRRDPGQHRSRAFRSRARVAGSASTPCGAPGASRATPRSSWSSAACSAARATMSWCEAVRRLKEMGLKDFVCVFVGEDQGTSRYTGELWDLVLADRHRPMSIRMAGPVDDLPAAYAAATVVVIGRDPARGPAAGDPRSAGDGAAGGRVRSRRRAGRGAGAAGGRRRPDDRAALLGRRFGARWPPPWSGCSRCRSGRRRAIGARGRAWVLANFNAAAAAEPTLRLYAEVAAREAALNRRNCNPSERPPLSGRNRCNGATSVIQTAIRAAMPLT